MARFYIIKDGTIKGSYETREEAVEMISLYRSREAHWLKSEYWILHGEEEFLKEGATK